MQLAGGRTEEKKVSGSRFRGDVAAKRVPVLFPEGANTGTAAAGNADLAHRYLFGTNVDELLADETVDDGTEDDTAWALTDHLNSVRDLVEYDPQGDDTSVIKHVAYDAFGNVTNDTALVPHPSWSDG